MKPFSPTSKCPKCGHDDIHSTYEEGYHYDCDEGKEHIDRDCKRCGYKWPERCLPKKKTPPQEDEK